MSPQYKSCIGSGWASICKIRTLKRNQTIVFEFILKGNHFWTVGTSSASKKLTFAGAADLFWCFDNVVNSSIFFSQSFIKIATRDTIYEVHKYEVQSLSRYSILMAKIWRKWSVIILEFAFLYLDDYQKIFSLLT